MHVRYILHENLGMYVLYVSTPLSTSSILSYYYRGRILFPTRLLTQICHFPCPMTSTTGSMRE